MNARDVWMRLRAVVCRRAVDRDLEDELTFHLEMQTRKNLAAGLPEAEARRRARVRFGPKPLVEDQCRDVRGISFLETLWQDVRYAFRSFHRAPTFAVTVIGTIALGLGLNAAFFTLFDAYALRPFAVRDPYSLYSFTWIDGARRYHSFTWPEYQQFRADNQVFSELFAGRKQVIARIDGHPSYGELVTGEYFHMLGVEAILGRTLNKDDASIPGRDAVIVLSHAFWQRHLAADPLIVGKTILIRGYPCEVIGVLRDGFAGLDVLPHDFWAPLTMSPQLEEGADLFGPDHPNRLDIVGRLTPGVTRKLAQTWLSAWAQRMTSGRRDDEKAIGVLLESRATSIAMSPMMLLLFAPIFVAFGLVMMIACANVANMMLARGLARQREIGIRLSLGAARSRVVRQLLTESALLALPAAGAGFVISQATVELGVRALFATMPAEYAEYIRFVPLLSDVRVVGFMLAAAAGSAVLFGLAPAFESTRPGLVQAARGDFLYNVRPARPRNVLVVIQISASVCLLICAGLLLRGSNRFRNIDNGLRTRDVIEIYVRERTRARVLPALGSVPVVRGIGAVSSVPLDATAPRVPVTAGAGAVPISVAYRFASPEFFAVFDIPLRAGRHFTAAESQSGGAVAIVSQTAARRLWPNGDGIGESLQVAVDSRLPGSPKIQRYSRVEVVGVAGDIATGYGEPQSDKTAIYLPASSHDGGTVLVARVSGDTEMARRAIDAALTAVDPGAVEHIHRMQELVVGRVYPLRVAYWLSAMVGGLALILTISGIYGLLSYVVAERAKEMGIRIALGATAGAVTGLVLKQSLKLAAAGLAIGAVTAVGAHRVLASRLVMVRTFDAGAYGWGMLLVLIACVAAAWVPAVRATHIDPVGSLRHD
jgi:putative ABC transport system permease protein